MINQNIKIAMFIDNYGGEFIGGAQVQVKNIKKILEEKYNCQIDIFAPKKADIVNRILWNLKVIFDFALKEEQNNYNLLHAHAYSPGLIAKLISLIWHKPLIFTVHGSNSLDIKQDYQAYKLFKNYKFDIKYCLEQFLLTRIKYDQIITVSQNFLKYKNINKNIFVIPNGIILSKKKFIEKKYKSKINILFIGRLERLKNLDNLIITLKNTDRRLFDYDFRIVGYGWELDNLKKLVNKLKLNNKIKFLGKLEGKKIEEEYKWADLFILPSISEGQPLTILEAMNYHVPVLVTRVGHNPFMIKDKVNGFLCNWYALEKGLKKVIKYQFIWNKIRKNANEMVKKDYLWDKCAAKTYQIYQQLLSNYD